MLGMATAIEWTFAIPTELLLAMPTAIRFTFPQASTCSRGRQS
jgi:hypothetical protein